MKPALAKAPENNSLEDLGRATLQIVHDLKNQLNGFKLYATFLRKSLEGYDSLKEERQILAKLIAGIDRAAMDTTALVRYARPIELRCQPHIDLQKLTIDAAQAASAAISSDLAPLTVETESGPLAGVFDTAALSEALTTLTGQAMGSRSREDMSSVSLHLGRVEAALSAEALVEWRGVKPDTREPRAQSLYGNASVHAALAVRIIEAHGGRVEYGANTIRAWLPLSG